MKLRSEIDRGGRRLAFTLVEVMIAVGVTSFVFASLYLTLSQSLFTWQRSRERLRGNQILLEKLEVIRLCNWTQITTPGFVPSTFSEYYCPPSTTNQTVGAGVIYKGTLAITAAGVSPAYDATMRKVVATLSWVRSGVTNRAQMETFVSQYGVQNYIY